MKTPILTTLFALGLVFAAPSAFSATTLTSDGFEASLGNWVGSADASLYSYGSGTNYATTGTGAARLNTGGYNGANPLTLSASLELAAATSVTIAFDYVWDATSSTRYFDVQYSANNGGSWSNVPGSYRTTASTTPNSKSYTISTGLTDQYLFRFLPKSDGSNTYAYLDNIIISAEGVTVPEPSAALLGGLGVLLLLRRRK